MHDRKKQINNGIPLIKDPFAIFGVEWFEKNYNSKMIISIRHPAAFVGSLKIKKWEIDYSSLLTKNIFNNNGALSKYRAIIEEYGKEKKDIIDQGILFWNLVHEKIKTYMENHPDWFYVKHEDISLEPLKWFKEIFEYLELPFTESIKEHIFNTTNSKTSNDIIKTSTEIFNIQRDSIKNISYWKKRLTSVEIERVFEGTKSVAKYFYEIS